MSDDLQRVRRDLIALQEAVGGPLPFVWRDVGYNLLSAGGGAGRIAFGAVGLLDACPDAGRRRAGDDGGATARGG